MQWKAVTKAVKKKTKKSRKRDSYLGKKKRQRGKEVYNRMVEEKSSKYVKHYGWWNVIPDAAPDEETKKAKPRIAQKKSFAERKKEKEFVVQTYDSDKRLTESLASGVQKRTYSSLVDEEMPDMYDLMCAVLYYRRRKTQGLSKEDRKFSLPNLSIDFSLDYKTAMTYGGSGIFHNCTSMAFFIPFLGNLL